MSKRVNVILLGDGDPMVFEASVGAHKYKVTARKNYYQQLTDGKVTPEELVRKSFVFLLEREGPESILKEFELPLIGHYFPEYEETIKRSWSH
jgi:hypothetical protein